MSQMVSITQEEYEEYLYLKKDYEESFSREENQQFLDNTRKAQERIDKGEYISVKAENLDEFLDNL